MKNFGVLTIGTRGDFQPMLAFAVELQKQRVNDQVYLIASEIYRNSYELAVGSCNLERKLEFRGLSGNPKETMQDPRTQQALKTGDYATLMALTARPGQILMEKSTSDMFELVKEIKFDGLISCSMGMPIIWMLSERYEIPIAYLGLVPEAPTTDFPFCVISPISLGSSEKNLASYDAVYKGSYARNEEMLNSQRMKLGLEKLKGKDWLSLKEDYDMPICYAFSKMAFGGTKPSGYRNNVELVGYLELKMENEKLDSNIEEFVKDGKEKPIFLSFGSMPAPDPFQLFELANHVLSVNSHRRVILSCGWTEMDQVMKELNEHKFNISTCLSEESEKYESLIQKLKVFISLDRLLIIKEAPYHLLFPKCSCIAHHCGAGTTGTALIAGIPQIPLPVFMDQPFWAHRMFELGVASSPISFKDISNDKLNNAIEFVLESSESNTIKTKASQISHSIATENVNPLQQSVNYIFESIVGEKPFIVPKI